MGAETRARIAAIVAREGEGFARGALGLSRPTLARLLAGLPVYPGTHALVRERLARLPAESPAAASAPRRLP